MGVSDVERIDLSKLSPQWVDDLEFLALARNAFEVMVRRGWAPVKAVGHRWILIEPELSPHIESGRLLTAADDPFTCLIETDRWYHENVEAKQ